MGLTRRSIAMSILVQTRQKMLEAIECGQSIASKWWMYTDLAKGGAMKVLPNTGDNIDSGYVGTAPELVFDVEFVKTGTHHVFA